MVQNPYKVDPESKLTFFLKALSRPAHLVAEYLAASKEFSMDAKRYLLVIVLQNIGYGILGTIFAIYMKDRGLSEAVVGDVEGALALAAAVVCLVVPPLVSNVGYRSLFVVAGLALGVSRVAQAFAPSALAIVGFGLMFGVGDGIMQTLSTAFLSEQSTRRTGTHLFAADFISRVMSMFVGAMIGGFLPALLCGHLTEVDAYRWTIVVAAALMGASTLVAIGIDSRSSKRGAAWRSYVHSVRAFRSWDRLGRLLVPEVLVSFGAGLIMPFVALFLKHRLGASVEQVGMIKAASAIAMALGAFLTPAISKRVGLAGTVVITQILSLPFLVAIPLSTSLPMVAVFMWARGALMNMSWPVYSQLSMAGIPSPDKPLVAGWIRLGWSIAWLGGSTMGGRLMEHSYTAPYFYTTALYAVGAVAAYLLLRHIDTDEGCEGSSSTEAA